jgi:hypothetical protein
MEDTVTIRIEVNKKGELVWLREHVIAMMRLMKFRLLRKRVVYQIHWMGGYRQNLDFSRLTKEQEQSLLPFW